MLRRPYGCLPQRLTLLLEQEERLKKVRMVSVLAAAAGQAPYY